MLKNPALSVLTGLGTGLSGFTPHPPQGAEGEGVEIGVRGLATLRCLLWFIFISLAKGSFINT
jgi:hypothetical protein